MGGSGNGLTRRDQWRKWRTPVISIVASRWSAISITSRVANRPARLHERAHAGIEARLDGVRERDRRRRSRRRPRSVEPVPSIACALATAWRAASTRDVWPLPMPMSRRSRTSTIAFDVTPRTRRHARSRSSCFVLRRGALGHAGPRRRAVPDNVWRGDEDRASSRSDRSESARCRPARAARLRRAPRRRARAGSVSWRGPPAPPRCSPGATTISRKIDVSASAIARSTSRVSATTPPNALTGSASSAADHASGRVARSAAPHGLVCLTMTTAGPRNPRPSAEAAAASSTLLYESCLALERRTFHRRTVRPRASSPDVDSAPPAGAGSRRSAASRPSRGRSTVSVDTGHRARPAVLRRPIGRAAPTAIRAS